MSYHRPIRRFLVLLAGLCILLGWGAGAARAADYGRLAGTVRDTEGNPLMGASVLITGPLYASAASAEPSVMRILTDAQGKFSLQRVVPGWYSLRVFSPTRLPALRNRVRVEAGETAEEKFVLGDFFAPFRLQAPSAKVSTWGEDWKWILRTSASTRPILRYQERPPARDAKLHKPPLPHSQRLVGVMTGSSRRDVLAGDAGQGSVLAYFRPLSEDSDLLMAASMAADGSQASSVTTALRRNLMKGDPQQVTLSVHQLSFGEGLPLPSGESRDSLGHAQAVVFTYTQTRRLSRAMSVTTGFEADYLTAATDVLTTRPQVRLDYRLNPSSQISVSYGTLGSRDDQTLLQRVGDLSAFPRVTMHGYLSRLEKLNHAEVTYTRVLGKNSRLEVAAYRDRVDDAALWGFAGVPSVEWLAGDFLPNPATGGLTLNAGNYDSSGVRVAVSRRMGNHVEVAMIYSSGEALALAEHTDQEADAALRNYLRVAPTQSFAGRVSARLPSGTEIVTSYEWLPGGRVTTVDPFGQASAGVQPFLGVEIRQPLPALAFFPGRIEALADFRNLLAEGYSPLVHQDDRMFLTPAYRSFRGGFSLEF
jgi:Carboxypeptidase regulatory-like domain